MALVHSVQPSAHFHYHNPVKSRREIHNAYHKYGCRRFAVDAREEVAKIAEIVGEDRTVEMAVRLVLPRDRATSAHDFSTKFGAPEHIAIELLQDIQRRHPGFVEHAQHRQPGCSQPVAVPLQDIPPPSAAP